MKGGTSIFKIIEALHANVHMPGSGFDLLAHEANDLCNDLIERVTHWTASDPGCEGYDELVYKLARHVLAEYKCAEGELYALCGEVPAKPEPDDAADMANAINAKFGFAALVACNRRKKE